MPTCPYCNKFYKNNSKYYENHVYHCNANPEVAAFNLTRDSVVANIYQAQQTATSLIEFLSTVSNEYSRLGVLINYTRIPELTRDSWGSYEWKSIEANIVTTNRKIFHKPDSSLIFRDLFSSYENTIKLHIQDFMWSSVSIHVLPKVKEIYTTNPKHVADTNELLASNAWKKFTDKVYNESNFQAGYGEETDNIKALQHKLSSLITDLDKVLSATKAAIRQQVLKNNLPDIVASGDYPEIEAYLPNLITFSPSLPDAKPLFDKAVELTKKAIKHKHDHPELFL